MRPLITVAAVVAALAGCGGGDETTSSAASSTPTAATGPTGAGEAQPVDPPETAGGDGGGGSEGDGGAATGPGSDPESALEAFFTSGDPDMVCGELATEELLANAFGDEKGCRQAQVPAAIAKSIEIKELKSSGDSTEAVVVPDGGPNDGFEHDVVLVRAGDSWLVDSLEVDIPAGP
jgi:hypothetical protein